MAKSKSFFGLRRGSTKSHTYSILNGQQITKDRVQTVANPQTQKQRYQRAIMATVMAAYSEMKDIEDHAFQGKKKGSENQREFMSRNLIAMRNAFFQYQENNPLESEQNFFAVGPKTPTVLPCAWVISSGTLQDIPFLQYNPTANQLVLPYIPTRKVSGNAESTLGEIADAFGVVVGTQITFLCINYKSPNRIFEVYPEDYAGYADYEFKYCRFVVKNFDRSKKYSFPAGSGEEGVRKIYAAALADLADDRTSPSMIPAFESIIKDERNEAYIDAETLLNSAEFDESITGAVGRIHSRVDEDLRGNSSMIVRNQAGHNRVLGLTWGYVPDAWRKTGAALGTSDLYLEGGE